MRGKMETLGWVTAFVGMIGLLVFSPVLTFGFAWIGGRILKVCVGTTQRALRRISFPWPARPSPLSASISKALKLTTTKGDNTNPGKPGSYEIGKHTVKLPVTA